MSRFLVLAIAAVCGVLLGSRGASAHDLRAVVTVADDVKVLAHFDDDVPAESAAARVLDAGGNEIAAGKTDERGTWAFPRPAPGQYTLLVECIGHTAKVAFAVEDRPGSLPVGFTNWRMSKAVGLTVGIALLLGISALSWRIQRRRRG